MWARVLAVGPSRDLGFFVKHSVDLPGAVCEGPIQSVVPCRVSPVPFLFKVPRRSQGCCRCLLRSWRAARPGPRWALLGLTADQRSGCSELTPSTGRCHDCKSPSCINPLLMDEQAGVKPRQGRRRQK